MSSAQALCDGLPRTTGISLDVNDTAALESQVAAHDLVISLIPYTYHATVIKAAIKSKTNVVTTSYVSPAMKELEEAAKKAGIVVMNEIGLDPGIDHLYAVKTIAEVHAKGGKVMIYPSDFDSYDTDCNLFRSKSSIHTAVVYLPRSAQETRSATNSLGHHEESCSLFSTTPLSMLGARSKMSQARNS